MKELIERAGARFLYHDGGIEHSSGLITSLVSRADRVLFPIDCVSHQAAFAIKRACRLLLKPYEPLRSGSLTCLISALARISKVCDALAPDDFASGCAKTDGRV